MPVIWLISSRENIDAAIAHSVVPYVGLLPCIASSPPYIPCDCPWNCRTAPKSNRKESPVRL